MLVVTRIDLKYMTSSLNSIAGGKSFSNFNKMNLEKVFGAIIFHQLLKLRIINDHNKFKKTSPATFKFRKLLFQSASVNIARLVNKRKLIISNLRCLI